MCPGNCQVDWRQLNWETCQLSGSDVCWAFGEATPGYATALPNMNSECARKICIERWLSRCRWLLEVQLLHDHVHHFSFVVDLAPNPHIAATREHLFDVTQAESEAEVDLDGMLNHGCWEAVLLAVNSSHWGPQEANDHGLHQRLACVSLTPPGRPIHEALAGSVSDAHALSPQ